MENNSLQHHGVIGMKWGIRRFQNKDGSLTNLGRKRKRIGPDSSEDAKAVSELRKKKVNQLSNAELRKLNERLQLEQTYSTLTKRDRSAAVKFCSDVMKEVGKEIAKTYVSKHAKAGIAWLGKMATK